MRNRLSDEQGFTLIELLVVILIIGILAAIAIPSFLGQTQKAQDASAKSDARNAVSAMESCFTDAQSYAACDNASLTAGGLTTTTGTEAGKVRVFASSATTYTIRSYSKADSRYFDAIRNASGTMTFSCSPVGGGCPTGLNWGA